MNNWKTSLAGILAILPQLLMLLFPKLITQDVANAITAILVGLGLIAAKDGINKTIVVPTGAQNNLDGPGLPPGPGSGGDLATDQ